MIQITRLLDLKRSMERMRLFALLSLALFFSISPAAFARSWTAPQLDDLERAALAAPEEGVPAAATATEHLVQMRRVRAIDPVYQGAVDLAADDLFAQLAQAFARGAINPASVDREWRLAPPPPTDIATLSAALDAGAAPSVLLRGLLPSSPDYRALRAELLRLAGEPDSETLLAQRAQIRANLERWRWLPRHWPERRVEVRLAQFELTFYPGAGAAPLTHAVIIGARRTPSPVFSAAIESVRLNPDWTPPQNILVNELLPRFRRDPSAAVREGFEAVDAEGQVVSAADIDWRARPFPYQVRQRAGPGNALGRLRFNLPNPYAVYLHDTPNRGLFTRADRALSHGCIRVQAPVALAAAVIGVAGWDVASLEAAIETGEPRTIDLAAPTPVYVLYLTTARGEDGAIVYLDDLYRRDRALIAALDAGASMAAVEEPRGPCAP